MKLRAVAQAPADNIVEAQHVSMVFGTGEGRHTVFEDISFDVSVGEFLCIVGSSGCGKTTLLRQIAGLQKPTSGTIRFNGQPVTRPTLDKAIVFQDYSKALLPWRTVAGNVALGLEVSGTAEGRDQGRGQRSAREDGASAGSGKNPGATVRRHAAAGADCALTGATAEDHSHG